MPVLRASALTALLATAALAALLAPIAAHPAQDHAADVHELRARLADLTTPSVCHVRRAEAVRVAETALSAARACKTGCDGNNAALEIALQVAKDRRCAGQAPASAVNATLAAFASASNAKATRLGARAPFRTIVLEPAGEAPHTTLVFLHGVRGRAANLVPFAQAALRAGAIPSGVRVLLPQAETRFVTFFNVTDASWFDLLDDDLNAAWASDEVDAAARNVTALLDLDARLHGTDRWKGAACGVSQGGALALATYLRERVAAVSTLSAFVPDPFRVPLAGDWKSRDSEAFLVHGDRDEVVDVAFARVSVAILRRLGRTVKYEEMPGLTHSLGARFPDRTLAALDFVARRMVPGRGDWKPAPPAMVWSLSA